MAFNQSIGRLSASWCRLDVGVIGEKIIFDERTKKFFITVASKTYCETACFSAEVLKGRENLGMVKGFKTEDPGVASSAVCKYQCISNTANGNSITEGNITVDDVEVFVFGAVDVTAMLCLWDGSICTQG